jgi:hypothetical protein
MEFSFHGATRTVPYVLLENKAPLPKAFIVGRAVTPDPDADLHDSLRRIDPRREVLLAKDVLADGPRSEFRRATIVKYTPGRVIVDAELDEPGYLVLSDVWYPGWRAAVDGRQTAVLMANAAFRAVPLTPGKHRIEFVYRTPGLLLGAAISALTLLALWWSVLGHATRRRRTTVGSESMKHDSDIQIHLAPPQLQGK